MRVALLRGINVGGHRRVPMAELRSSLEDAGLTDVATYIQSGNVWFEGGPAHRSAASTLVADVVEEAFGFRVPVIVRTVDELAAAVAAHPFEPPPEGEKMLHVLFCEPAPTASAVDGLDAARAPHDDWALIGADLHIRYGRGSATSKATVDWFERELGVTTTGRNLVTVRALVERAPA